jgi:hypothetical protein
MKFSSQNSVENKIKIFTEKLNKLRIKQAFYTSSELSTPEYITKQISMYENELKVLNSRTKDNN